MKHPSKLPIDTLWQMFTTKFNRNHNLENPGDAKQPEQLKVFFNKVSNDIFKMFGGDKDFNHKKDMPPIASLVFAMRKERDEKEEQYNFVQQTIKANKEMVRKGKVALASYHLLANTFGIFLEAFLPEIPVVGEQMSKASSNIVIHPAEDFA